MDQNTITHIKRLLRDDRVENLCITFTKADGTERVMRCTLNEDQIPLNKIPKDSSRPSSETTQRVFDLDLQEWRSFKWENVKSYTHNIIGIES